MLRSRNSKVPVLHERRRMTSYKCQFCESTRIEEILFLGYLPPVNVMSEQAKPDEVSENYSLPFCFCIDCKLTQIGTKLEKTIVFPKSYPYLSGVTQSLVRNFYSQSQSVNKLLRLNKSDLVIDIGSNDGSLLEKYQEFSRVLGIEPTIAADSALRKGIPTINSFFTETVVDQILKDYGKARVITACNVFAHIDGLDELMLNIKRLISDKGIFVSESHYLLSLVDTLQFDTIYHEHLRYYTISFLESLFNEYEMEIFDVEKIDSHGGSVRVWACNKGTFEVKESVISAKSIEASSGVLELDGLRQFAGKVIHWRHEFRRLVSSLKLEGATISGIGAPSRASTLIAFSGLTELDLDNVAEVKNSAKIGRVMPGTRIPVIQENLVLSQNPSHLLLLSWHLKDSIIWNLRKAGYTGKFIVPLPQPHIID